MIYVFSLILGSFCVVGSGCWRDCERGRRSDFFVGYDGGERRREKTRFCLFGDIALLILFL